MNIILGIDPGLSNTGWAVIGSESNNLKYVASGTIVTNPKHTSSERLTKIYEELSKVIAQYKPLEFAIEDSFVNNNALSSLKLGQARGASIIAAGVNKLQVFEYEPRLVKKAVVGSGGADKTQVMAMVKFLIPKAQIKNEHEADAMAVAICHCNISATQRRMQIQL